MNIFEAIGAILGIAGAILVTGKEREKRFIAFNLWIVGNISLIVFYIINNHWGLTFMGSIYTVTSCIGWWNTRKD